MTIDIIHYNPKISCYSASFPLKQNINNGITHGKNGMPSKFASADGGSSFAIGRTHYVNTKNTTNQTLEKLYTEQKPHCSYTTGRRINRQCVRGGKPFNIESADQHIQKLKNLAIGKGSMPGQNTASESHELSFKSSTSSNLNTVRSAVRRCRNSGAVAPAKKNHYPGCK